MVSQNDFFTNYALYDESNNQRTLLRITTGIDFTFSNSILKYESVTGNGGETVNTGRLIHELTVTLALVGDVQDNLKCIQDIYNKSTPLNLVNNYDRTRLFGKYYISNIGSSIVDGTELMYLDVTLVEFREGIVNLQNIVISGDKNAQALIEVVARQNAIDRPTVLPENRQVVLTEDERRTSLRSLFSLDFLIG